MRQTLFKPLRGIEVIWRGLYGIDEDGNSYVVEVDYFDFKEGVRLYCNGSLKDEQSSPAHFMLDSGSLIEASMALYGMKKACLITGDGREKALLPLPGTAEGQRMLFDRTHPHISRALAFAAWVVLVFALITQVPHAVNGLLDVLSRLPFGLQLPSVPVCSLPEWLNVALSVAGIAAGLDRGLRMVHNPVIDD